MNIITDYTGIHAAGVAISNTTVDIQHGNEGIYSDEGDLTVNDSSLTITGPEDSGYGIYVYNGNVNIGNNSDVVITTAEVGICVYYGDVVEINSGTVTITDVGTGIESCNSDVKMNGGTVTIASKEYGIDVVGCNVTMKDGCDLIIESEDTAINKDEESTITVDSDSQAITVYMGVSAESATSTTYTAGNTISLPTPEPPTEEGPPESNFKYFSTVAPAIEGEPDAVNWSTLEDGDYINAGTIIYNDTEDEIEIFVDTYAAAIEDELIDDESYQSTDDFETYRYTYYESIIIQPGERYQVLDKYTSGSTDQWYDGETGYEFGAERWKLYTYEIEHILYPAVRPGETPSSEGRTKPLDFVNGTEWQTGCTQDGNVWTNAAENWSWDTATNTLTLSGCTIDVPQSQGAMAAVVLPDGAKVTTAADTQNTLSIVRDMSSAILGMGAVSINGSGSLTVSGTEGGLYAMGNLAINAPISATTTISRGGMAVLGASVTIDSSLSITTPAGGKVVKIGRMTGIADSEGTFFAAEVVISASGGTETPSSGTRTTPLDFTEEADTPAWKTGCEQSEDNNAVWTNATEKWSWNTATNTLTLSGFKFVNENAPGGFVAILLPRESHIYLERGTENSVNVRSSSFCSAIGSNTSLTISGDGELDITSSYMGIMTGGNITINSPISVKSTSDDAMAILIESENQDDTITIADTLEITKPDGATFHESGKTILDSKGSFAKEVVISAKGGIAKYTVTFNATGGTLSNYTSTTNNSGKLTSLPAPTRDGYAFKGWYDAVTGGNKITTDTVFTANATIYAQWIKTYSVSGQVVNEAGETAVEGATVTIKNNTVEKTATTEADGSFTLSDIPAGEYNIVVTFGGKTVTKLVTITNSNVSGINVVIPTGDVSSVVETTGSGTPKVLVGGLDELAKAKENEGTTVEVKLTVEQKAADAVDETAKNEIVVAAAKDQLEYLDMTVNMTVDGGAPSPITNTGKVLEIIVPYDMTDKYNIAVYRHHDGQAQAFRKLTVRPTSDYRDGTFFVGDDFIVIYTSKFSYYAVGYDTTPSTPSTSSGSSGGGTSAYSVSVPNDIAGGKVSLSHKNAAKGTTVTITVTAEENQKLDKLTVTDQNGNELKLTKVSDDKYTFVMPAGKVSIDAVFKAVEAVSEQETEKTVENCSKDGTCPMNLYKDVKTTEWYHDGVHFCIDKDYMKGYPDGTFQPGTATSRAMIVSILWRMEGKPVVNDTLTFNDVKANDWYAEAVRWAASNKVVNGYSDTVFAPNDAITREQMMAILWRYSQYKGYDVSVGEDTNILSYRDFDKISEWAIPAMQWACGSGLIYGMDNSTLDAQENATRAQAANILYRLAG